MSVESLCAIVVTYHPEPVVLENLRLLGEQVPRIVVVDNGSDAAELAPLRALACAGRIELLENGANLGIAQALNRGVLHASTSEWLLLFDQDSRVLPGFAEAMLGCARRQADDPHAALWVPRYFDSRFDHVLPPLLAPGGKTLAVAMTSGTLVRRTLFDRVGLFEDWFIYEIDYEFSLRIRRLGYTLHSCAGATLMHAPASPAPVVVLGRRLFYARNYKPRTRYFMQRNGQWMRRRYGRDFPEYFRAKRRSDLKEYLVVLLGERDKLRKLGSMIRGFLDGCRGVVPTTLEPDR